MNKDRFLILLLWGTIGFGLAHADSMFPQKAPVLFRSYKDPSILQRKIIYLKQTPVGYWVFRQKTEPDGYIQSDIHSRLYFFSGNLTFPSERNLKVITQKDGLLVSFVIEKRAKNDALIQGFLENGFLHLKVRKQKRTYIKKLEVTEQIYLPDLLMLSLSKIKQSQTIYIFNDFTLQIEQLIIETGNFNSPEMPHPSEYSMVTRFNFFGQESLNYLDQNGNLLLWICPDFDIRVQNASLNDIEKVQFETFFVPKFIACDKKIIRPRFCKKLVLEVSPEILQILSNDCKTHVNGIVEFRKQKPVSIRLSLSEIPENTSPILAKAARKIIKNSKKKPDQWIHELNDWVLKFIKDKNMHQLLTLEEILQTRSGDCKAHAILFSEIAKLLGIKTEYVVGLVYDQEVFCGHMWINIHVNNDIISVDPVFRQVGVDATHIEILSGEDFFPLLFQFHQIMIQLNSESFIKIKDYFSAKNLY